MTSEGPWTLQMPFSAPKLRFTEELSETVGDLTIYNRPGTAPYSRLVVEGIDTIDEARKQFSALKRAMLAASLNVGCGIRVKGDLTVLDDDKAQLPREADQPFACRQGRSLARLIIGYGDPEFQLSRVLPRFKEGIELAMTSDFAVEAMRDKWIALACELYTDSFFEKSIAASFVTLIGALEILKDKDPVHLDAIQLIDTWKDSAGGLEKEEMESLCGQLDRMKRLSIKRGIGRVVARNLGQDKSREVRRLYDVRSSLVHDGVRPPDLGDHLEHTHLIVRELLIKILHRGAR